MAPPPQFHHQTLTKLINHSNQILKISVKWKTLTNLGKFKFRGIKHTTVSELEWTVPKSGLGKKPKQNNPHDWLTFPHIIFALFTSGGFFFFSVSRCCYLQHYQNILNSTHFPFYTFVTSFLQQVQNSTEKFVHVSSFLKRYI